MKDYRHITGDEQLQWENILRKCVTDGFDELVLDTWDWLSTPAAHEYFRKQNVRLTKFMRDSGIQERWQDIIDERAERGVDVTRQIFDYARSVNMTDPLVDYTRTERAALNRLCDYNYELIRNVTQDEVTAIRRKLVQDFANGTYPLRTSLKELELEPINGFSPRQRAEMIARTESARTLNVSTLETMRNDGVDMVVLYGCDSSCDTCSEYFTPTPIDVALEVEVPHPNCTGVWITAGNAPEPPKPGEEWE